MKLRRTRKGNKAQARLNARIKAWEDTQRSIRLNKDAFRKPGSMKK